MPGKARAKEFMAVDFGDALRTVRQEVGAADFLAVPSPEELKAIYDRGFRGLKPETTTADDKKRFRNMISAMPDLYTAFPWCKGLGKNRLLCPWTAILQLDPQWGGDDAQERGDCTVHGTAHAAAIDYGCDALFGETTYKGRLACENIYRSRGFNGDGWSCEAPCSYIGPDGSGGLLYRKVWEGGGQSVDLSKYNSSWEGNGGAGVPSWMEEESRKNKVKLVIPITDPDLYFDALAAGGGINVCSGQGFSSDTDEWGVASAQGSWSHSMAHTGGDNRDTTTQKYGTPLGGIQQSWGAWNTQNGVPPGAPKSPVGMFYAKMSVIAGRMLGDDSFALFGVQGWERHDWQAFDVTEYRDKLLEHLRDSTVQDRYEARAKKALEHAEKVAAEGFQVV